MAAILLIISAVITGVVSPLLSGGPVGVLVYVASAGANLIFSIAIAWMGLNLFTKRDDATYQPPRERRGSESP